MAEKKEEAPVVPEKKYTDILATPVYRELLGEIDAVIGASITDERQRTAVAKLLNGAITRFERGIITL